MFVKNLLRLDVKRATDLASLAIVGGVFLAICFALGSDSSGLGRITKPIKDTVRAVFVPAMPPAAFSHPDVLLVTSQQAERISVVGTLEPRGLHVLIASDVRTGLARMADSELRAGMLIVDGNLADKRRLVQKARERFPKILVVELERPQQPAKLATDLMNYVSRMATL